MESSQESIFYIDPFDIEFEDWPQLGVATTPVTAATVTHDQPARPDSPQSNHLFASSSSPSQRVSTAGSTKSNHSLHTAATTAQAGGIVCLPPILHVPFSDLSKPAHLTFRIANHGTQPCRFRVFLATGAPTFTLELDKLAVLYPGKEQVVHLHAQPTSGWLDHVDEVCVQTNVGKEIRVPVVLSPAPCAPQVPGPLRVAQGQDARVEQVIAVTNPTPRTFHLSAKLAAGNKSVFVLDRDTVKVEGNDSASLTVTSTASDFPPPKSTKPTVHTDTLTLTLDPSGPSFNVPLTLHLLPPPRPPKPSRSPTKHKSTNHPDHTLTQPSAPTLPPSAIPFNQLWLQHDAAFRAHVRQFTPWTTYAGIPPTADVYPEATASNELPAQPTPSPPPALSPPAADRMDALFKSQCKSHHSLPPPPTTAAAHAFRMHCRARLARAIHVVVVRCRMNARLRAIRAWATQTCALTAGRHDRIGGTGSVLGLAHGSREVLHVPAATTGFRGGRDGAADPQPLRPKSGAGTAAAAGSSPDADAALFNESLLVLLSEMDLAPDKRRLIDPLPAVPEAAALDEHGDGLGAVAGDADRPGTAGGDGDGGKKGENRRTSVSSAGSKRGSAGGARPGTATGKGGEKVTGAAAGAGGSKPGSSKGRGVEGAAGGSRPSSRQGAVGQKPAVGGKVAGTKGSAV